jgi:hypothetical protein
VQSVPITLTHSSSCSNYALTARHQETFSLSMSVLSAFGVSVMMFNATFNNISVISWQSVLLVEQTGVPGGKTTSPITDKLTRRGTQGNKWIQGQVVINKTSAFTVIFIIMI